MCAGVCWGGRGRGGRYLGQRDPHFRRANLRALGGNTWLRTLHPKTKPQRACSQTRQLPLPLIPSPPVATAPPAPPRGSHPIHSPSYGAHFLPLTSEKMTLLESTKRWGGAPGQNQETGDGMDNSKRRLSKQWRTGPHRALIELSLSSEPGRSRLTSRSVPKLTLA